MVCKPPRLHPWPQPWGRRAPQTPLKHYARADALGKSDATMYILALRINVLILPSSCSTSKFLVVAMLALAISSQTKFPTLIFYPFRLNLNFALANCKLQNFTDFTI